MIHLFYTTFIGSVIDMFIEINRIGIPTLLSSKPEHDLQSESP